MAEQAYDALRTQETRRPGSWTPSSAMDAQDGIRLLTGLLNKTFRVLTTDGRIFVGQFKCTDPDRNIVLSHTYEYRPPTQRELAKAAAGPLPSANAPPSRMPSSSSTGIGEAAAATTTTTTSAAVPPPQPPADGSGGSSTANNDDDNGTTTVRLDMSSRYLGLVVVPGQYIVRLEAEYFSSQGDALRRAGLLEGPVPAAGRGGGGGGGGGGGSGSKGPVVVVTRPAPAAAGAADRRIDGERKGHDATQPPFDGEMHAERNI